MENQDNDNNSDAGAIVGFIGLTGLAVLCAPIFTMEFESHIVNNRPIFQEYENMTPQERALEDVARARLSSAYNIRKGGDINRFSLLYQIQEFQKRK